MLERYGSELALMDATYKTTRYAIPLFFVCVHTNVGYKVVAEFICQSEDQASISEALAIIKGWNPAWNPAYFMVDYSNAEIAALEQQFPKSLVYIFDFHRLQAMHRWSKSKKNGLSSAEQDIFLEHMKRITYANTVDKFEKRVNALKESRLYKEKPNVQNYLNNTWLSCKVRWAQAFRKQQVTNIVNTNNGTEAQNKLFKYEYLPRSVDKSVYGIATMLVESFIPDSHRRYLEKNLKFSDAYGRYNSRIPTYLHNRPPQFVKHCLDSRFAAGEFTEADISSVNFQKGQFSVKSAANVNKKELVDFSYPSCTCTSWKKSNYPCKHFFAVFARYSQWRFESLPHQYRSSVFISIDLDHLIINKHDSNAQNCGIPKGTAKSSSSSDGRPRLANASGDESMDCEQAEAESVEKSVIELPNNSPNGTTTTSTVEKMRKRFLDKIDTVKNIT